MIILLFWGDRGKGLSFTNDISYIVGSQQDLDYQVITGTNIHEIQILANWILMEPSKVLLHSYLIPNQLLEF